MTNSMGGNKKDFAVVDADTSPWRTDSIYLAIVIGLPIVATLLFLISSHFHYSRYIIGSYNRSLLLIFDLNTEGNVPTWFSSMLLFASGLSAVYCGRISNRLGLSGSRMWILLGICFIALSLDEIASFHEMSIRPIQNEYQPTGFLHYGWVIPGAAVVILFLGLFAHFIRQWPSAVRNPFLLGFGIYVTGCLVMECIGAKYDTQHGQNNMGYAWITGIEEWLEMLGVITILAAFRRQVTLWRRVSPSDTDLHGVDASAIKR